MQWTKLDYAQENKVELFLMHYKFKHIPTILFAFTVAEDSASCSDFTVLRSADSFLQSCYLVIIPHLIFVRLIIIVEVWSLGISLIKLFHF